MVDHLIALAESEPGLVAGLDFSFSMPAWYLDHLGVSSAPELWEAVARDGERWLSECLWPFFGKAGTRRPEGVELLRHTEAELAPIAGTRPKSVFQIAGPGQVGPGSIRGMPLLTRLRAAGFRVWPFDSVAPGFPTVAEIYPRQLTGAVVKRDPAARRLALRKHRGAIAGDLRDRAAASEDAFDAALAAVVLDRHRGELGAAKLPPEAAREGAIWAPVG